MPDLRLSLAISDYVHTRDVADGRIKPVGIELVVNDLSFEQAAFRFGANREFDISEFSLANFCAIVSAPGGGDIVGLPVFPSRVFRHSSIYVNEKSGIRSASELQGRTVGIPQWSQTATVYVRGFLQHDAGVPLASIKWVQAGVDQAGRHEPVKSRLPDGVTVEAKPDRTLSDMLIKGEIDAMITARPPRSFLEGKPGVKRLYPDYRKEEERYFAKTGIFPIMHVVAMKRKVYEANPWIARNLFDAFEAAKRAAIPRLYNIQSSYLPTAWIPDDRGRMHRLLFSDGEPWPYGLELNRATIEPFLAYCDEQGITQRRLAPEELFPREVAFEIRI
jgi:4,5-dihydroxyphthalate decarboxylase